jgi:hypothetical protein
MKKLKKIEEKIYEEIHSQIFDNRTALIKEKQL